jgi:hypothetical protein
MVKGMAELTSEKADKKFVSDKPPILNQPKTRVCSSLFKYYIHDSVEACRFELIGQLTEAEIQDLNGCWRTAKTTFGRRKLILDLQGLQAVDEVAKEWLMGMANEGATYLPDSFLRTGLAAASVRYEAPPKPGFFTRVLSIFRGSRVVAAESSTQAQ